MAAMSVSSPPVSSSESDFAIEWYGEKKLSEMDLLEGYFSRHPRLAKQVSDMKANKGKRQTDGNLVRDYKFTLEVYDRLLKHEWKACLLIYPVLTSSSIPVTQTDSGLLLNKTIQKYLGRSAAWFTRARKIIELLKKIGDTDPLVNERLSSKATNDKGEDILTFLMLRAQASEAH